MHHHGYAVIRGLDFQVCISMQHLLLVEDVNVTAWSEGPMGMFVGDGMNAQQHFTLPPFFFLDSGVWW